MNNLTLSLEPVTLLSHGLEVRLRAHNTDLTACIKKESPNRSENNPNHEEKRDDGLWSEDRPL